jgi:glycosyltransferase involved in cell wall biosynthesis
MKILQIINSLGTGGAEKLLLDTIPLYRQAGVEMDVLVFWNDNHQFINALRALNCCKVIVLKESDNYKDIYALSHIWKLRTYLKQYDVAHIHLFPAQYFSVLANISIGNGCKLVFTEHNTTNRRIQNSYFRYLEKWIYSFFKKIVCISPEIQRIYKDYLKGFEPKLVLIENGVNLEVIREAVPLLKCTLHSSISDDDTVIVQVSAFRIQKDQKTLIEALALLPLNVKLILVGDGVLKKECEELAEALGLQGRVLFLGQRMDIPQLLKTADIVVLSSKYEGLSLSSIEGMASGRPFVASDVPGLSEIVGGAGVLFECGNAQKLATEIGALLDDKAYYDQVVRTCQERAQQFDIHKMIQKHIDLYKSISEN